MCEQSALAVVQDVRGLAGDLVYDCRPPLLPVSIPLRDVCCSSTDRPTAPSSLVVAPVEVISGSVRERVANPGFVETPSDAPGTDVEDELEFVSLLPMTISPLLDSDAAIPMSPARYLEPPPPALASSPTPPPAKYCIAGACVVRPGGFTSHDGFTRNSEISVASEISGGNGPDPGGRSGFSYG